jgi:hypothetical protein
MKRKKGRKRRGRGRGLRSVVECRKGRCKLSPGNVKVKGKIERSQIEQYACFRCTAKCRGQSKAAKGTSWLKAKQRVKGLSLYFRQCHQALIWKVLSAKLEEEVRRLFQIRDTDLINRINGCDVSSANGLTKVKCFRRL